MAFDPTHLRGDIWSVDFGSHPENPEQAFVRPAVIVSDDRLHHPSLQRVIVVPGTTALRGIPLHVPVDPDAGNGLDTTTAFQAEQVRAISTARLITRLGRLAPEHQWSLSAVLAGTLALEH